MTKLTLSQLSSLLFRACDDLRGNMDATHLRHAVPESGLLNDLISTPPAFLPYTQKGY